MARINSKNKGSTFERKIANILSEKFMERTGIKTSFRRNIDSGSYFGGKNQSRVDTHDLSKAVFGDLVAPDNFRFSIECKHYKEPPSFAMLVKQDWKVLDKWLEQATQDSANSGKEFAIIIKYNNVDEIVVLPSLFGDLTALINYKGHVIVSLRDYLAQTDGHFFRD